MTEKPKRDPNRHRFKEESNGELFQIELDALQFKDLVVNTVNSYYDEKNLEAGAMILFDCDGEPCYGDSTVANPTAKYEGGADITAGGGATLSKWR